MTPPIALVAFSIGAQKINTVVKPQYAKSNCIIRYEGYVIIINPPMEVKIKEIDNNFLGEYLSAKTPPYKYEKNATTPYMENKPPNSRLVKLNTSRNVGLKTLANTYGRI